MKLSKNLTNPKQDPTASLCDAWYPYYASYSSAFVVDVLTELNLSTEKTILDPWNGSGTTTATACRNGFPAVGYDRNPAMLMIAKARTMTGVNGSVQSLCNELIRRAQSSPAQYNYDELLNVWLKPEATNVFRSLDCAVRTLLVDTNPERLIKYREDQVSEVAAFFYVALFNTIRESVRIFTSSNPTWVKLPSDEKNRLIIPSEQIYALFQKHALLMQSALALSNYGKLRVPVVDVASSEKIPLRDDSVDAVISSPPYCTRIDYVKATLPELAILGYTQAETNLLRREMIGSPTISTHLPEQTHQWGRTCNLFLDQVRKHPSKASESYYLKTFLQYFDASFRSLSEINRVLAPKSLCILVIQDSYYKDVHNDLPKVYAEMGKTLGWSKVSDRKFSVLKNMANINQKVAYYRGSAKTTESVLLFKTRN